MKEKTLVILAAGMGSRFGGLKQIEPVGPNGEFIIDYSIYDAIKNGFNKIVFIIKEENYNIFKETIGKRIEKHVKVEYVFQSFKEIPKDVKIPENRIKPLGTAQALYCAKNNINGPFAVISADDFYGPESFELLSNSINSGYSIIGYNVGNTITENGSVKRGIIFADENNYLKSIKECKVEKINGVINCETLDKKEHFIIEVNHPVSMLMNGFQREFIQFIEKDIKDYFLNMENDLETCEYLLPDVIDRFIKNNKSSFKVINTPSKWYGMTYKEDLIDVKNNIMKLIKNGVYKNDLWS